MQSVAIPRATRVRFHKSRALNRWHLLLIVGRRIGRMVGLPPMLAGPSAGRNRAMRENQSRLRERKSVQCPVNELGEVGAVCLHAPMPFWVPTQVAFPPMRWNVPTLSHIVPSSGGNCFGVGGGLLASVR